MRLPARLSLLLAMAACTASFSVVRCPATACWLPGWRGARRIPAGRLVALRAYSPRARRQQCTMSVHPDDMRRADDPLQEEIRGLQMIGGVLGFVFGPLLCGSGVLGIFLGVMLGNYLAFIDGRRGAMLREAGWQVFGHVATGRRRTHELWTSLRESAQARGVPEALTSAREAVTGFASQLGEEIAALDRASNASTRAISFVGDQRERLQGWAASKGITPRLAKLYRASGLADLTTKVRAALTAFEQRVEERLQGL
jgi:hypothetical protein